ncbi:MAG: helix-turn-helix domain-containing protein [Solirubrobacteraceae bacterium]|jgi:hypothetical protein
MIEQDLPLDRPWQALDPAVGVIIEPALGEIAEQITAAIASEITEYRGPMEGSFGRGVRSAIDGALREFVDLLGRPAGSGERPGRTAYVALGRGEYRAGRRLDALQAAYRLGARVAWRRISTVARAAGLDGPTLSLLAESIFAYIDEVSADSVEGYASEQAASAGERQGLRQAFVRQLVAGGFDAGEIELAARAAEWEVPRRLGVLVAEHRDAERLATRIGGHAIGGRVEDLACVLIADPDAPGARARVARAVEGRLAALGPTVAIAGAGRSWARAARCARLSQQGVLPAERLVVYEEALGALALFADPEALGELARDRLAPLAGQTVAARARLEATLLSWLRWQGSVPTVAAELHVHPQTVRYRLERLRECFGAQLEDPDARFELELSLRAGRTLGEPVQLP